METPTSELSESKLQDHVSPSIYVAFKCIESRSQHTLNGCDDVAACLAPPLLNDDCSAGMPSS